MSAVEQFLEGLEGVHKSSNGWEARCPAHHDRQASLSITEGDGGKVILHCHAGCSYNEVVAAHGRSIADLFPPDSENGHRTIVARYPYTDESGTLLFEVVRYEPKDFRQRRPNGSGWVWNLRDTHRVLYRLPQVLEAVKNSEPVWIVEGEKDVHALERIGLTATCNPAGAKKWRPEYGEPLRGARVVVCGDCDKAGRESAESIATALVGAAKDVRLLDLNPQCEDGHDVGDFLRDARTDEERADARRALLKLALEETSPFRLPADESEGTQEGTSRLKIVTARAICGEPDPAESDELVGPIIRRRGRTVIGGHTGDGKTTLAYSIAHAVVTRSQFLGWEGAGGRVLIIDAEQGRKTVKRRLREVGLEDSDAVDVLLIPDGLQLDKEPDQVSELQAVLEVGEYALVILDPLYKLHGGDSNAEREATDLMRIFDRWRDHYGFALLLVTHCRKPVMGAKFTMHELFGSSAYLRGAEVVLGIQRLSDGYSKLHIFKDRDGDLPVGEAWGLLFDRQEGFRRDPNDGEPKATAKDKVKEALDAESNLTEAELCSRTGYAERTVRDALRANAAVGTDTSPKRWSLSIQEELAA